MRQYIVGAVTILILIGISMAGYTYFTGASNTDNPGYGEDTGTTQSEANITRQMPNTVQPGETATVRLVIESEKPVNLTIHEYMQMDDNASWQNITVQNVRNDDIFYNVDLPNQTGIMEFTGHISNASGIIGGDTEIDVSSSGEPVEADYTPPNVENLLPEETDEGYSRTDLNVQEPEEEGVKQHATAVYQQNNEDYDVEVQQYAGSEAAWNNLSAEVATYDEDELEWFPYRFRRGYQINDTVMWTDGYFTYEVTGSDSRKLMNELVRVYRQQ